jgi:hypothetical protein
MNRPSPQVTKALAASVRQFPVLLEWLREWELQELRRLPSVVDNTGIYQGRCQVLGELTKFANDAPNLAAQVAD